MDKMDSTQAINLDFKTSDTQVPYNLKTFQNTPKFSLVIEQTPIINTKPPIQTPAEFLISPPAVALPFLLNEPSEFSLNQPSLGPKMHLKLPRSTCNQFTVKGDAIIRKDEAVSSVPKFPNRKAKEAAPFLHTRDINRGMQVKKEPLL
ncbi:conserved hypothetical protein [Ricinus communis]|uniref:Uncharacterized protein n=1 Tax=Ricinus communis TaxID=3988 RepID=B9RHG9_RICCO|nr:conserved hypothetical protein [Ricinus communis]